MKNFRKVAAIFVVVAMMMSLFAFNFNVFADNSVNFSVSSEKTKLAAGESTIVSVVPDTTYTAGFGSAIAWEFDKDAFTVEANGSGVFTITTNNETGVIKLGVMSAANMVAGEPIAQLKVTAKADVNGGSYAFTNTKCDIVKTDITGKLEANADSFKVGVGDIEVSIVPETAKVAPGGSVVIDVVADTTYTAGFGSAIAWSFDKDLFTVEAEGSGVFTITTNNETGVIKLGVMSAANMVAGEAIAKLKITAKDGVAESAYTFANTKCDIVKTDITGKLSAFANDIKVVVSSTPEPTATTEPVPTATTEPVPTATTEPVPTATTGPVPTATTAPAENYIATLNVTNGTGTLTNASGEVYPTVAPATEAPVPTEGPIVTDAPVPTDEPIVTDAPAPTEEPIVTEAPVPGKSVEWTFADAPEGTKLVNSSNKEKEWYVGNVDLGNGLMSYSNGTVNAEKQEYTNAFEVDRTSDTEFTLENGTTETVTGALKFGGKTTADARYFTYTPSADGAITAYVKHGSPDKINTDIRNLIVEQGSEKTIVETIGTDKKFVVQTVPVVANSEVKISCDNNVGLAKLVYTPAAKTASVAADTAGAQYIIPAGDTVTINAVSNIAGETAVVTVKAADGTDIAVSDSKFVMPEQNASVDVVFGGSAPTPSADPATITTIAGSITAPASNRAVSYDITAPEGARYKLSDVSWNPAVESRYDYNTVYTITFTATADENCTISADAVATVNTYDADSITVSADGKTAVVTYEFAKTSKKSSGGGGTGPDTGNTGKATATPAPTKAPTPTTEPGDQVFEDVPSTYWAYSYIMDLYDAGIVNGASATMFYPENNVTRAEFTKMAVVLFGLDSKSTESQFTDVPANEWYAKYIVAATEAGIVTGISETEFAPNDDVTREQMAAIIGRYLDITSNAAMKYSDSAAISDYAVPYVSGLTEKGLLTGEEDGTFRPAASAARSEAAALLSRVKATMKTPEETAAPEQSAAPEATASAEPEATATAAPEATATPSK